MRSACGLALSSSDDPSLISNALQFVTSAISHPSQSTGPHTMDGGGHVQSQYHVLHLRALVDGLNEFNRDESRLKARTAAQYLLTVESNLRLTRQLEHETALYRESTLNQQSTIERLTHELHLRQQQNIALSAEHERVVNALATDHERVLNDRASAHADEIRAASDRITHIEQLNSSHETRLKSSTAAHSTTSEQLARAEQALASTAERAKGLESALSEVGQRYGAVQQQVVALTNERDQQQQTV